METFFVYILYSKSIDQYYIGQTGNLRDRLNRHNNKSSKSTKKASDWTIVYQQQFDNRAEAVRRELEIKSKKSRRYIEALL